MWEKSLMRTATLSQQCCNIEPWVMWFIAANWQDKVQFCFTRHVSYAQQNLHSDILAETQSPPTGYWLMCFHILHCRIIREQTTHCRFLSSQWVTPSAHGRWQQWSRQHGASHSPSSNCILIQCREQPPSAAFFTINDIYSFTQNTLKP